MKINTYAALLIILFSCGTAIAQDGDESSARAIIEAISGRFDLSKTGVSHDKNFTFTGGLMLENHFFEWVDHAGQTGFALSQDINKRHDLFTQYGFYPVGIGTFWAIVGYDNQECLPNGADRTKFSVFGVSSLLDSRNGHSLSLNTYLSSITECHVMPNGWDKSTKNSQTELSMKLTASKRLELVDGIEIIPSISVHHRNIQEFMDIESKTRISARLDWVNSSTFLMGLEALHSNTSSDVFLRSGFHW